MPVKQQQSPSYRRRWPRLLLLLVQDALDLPTLKGSEEDAA
jgi:hypothetical protein